MENEPETSQLEKIVLETLTLDKNLNSKFHNNVEPGNKMVRIIKGHTLLERKIKGSEREDTGTHQMNQVMAEIHQMTQIVRTTHLNLKRKKYPRMNITHQQQKSIRENLKSE